ncbi:glycosyltransferase [Acetobacterium bakii]|uniref:Sterol 3-beta-glucosyltransferase n=1 Tax=Acetobacterium bakii TaxID=52689 RepID=A0A0L6U041_9FIRM|nr:glycosyltransferase [Acetobacterium bakii]KNZ41205.1 sterol 3-beta-glucosyltransferase [Acetobacterium bakii]
MKVIIFTLGTRGDVQPYVALARGLIKKGHEALICTGKSFKKFIEDNGIAFHEATADLMAILESEEGRKIFNGGNFNLFKMMKYAKEVVNPAYRKSMDDFLTASEGGDIIIYHPKALAAVDIANYRDIPCVSMPPVPITYPITEFPNLAMFPEKNLGSVLNKLTYKANLFAESGYIKDINDFRAKSLGFDKRKSSALTFTNKGGEIPIIYPISPFLFKDVTSWDDHVFLPGFFYLDILENSLDANLEQFLASGKKPIVVSFSSMPLKDPGAFKEKLIEALKETDNRGIILTGTSGLVFEDEENIFAIAKAPHRLVFKEAKGIIHHGGVGTMAEALISGAPQLIIPFSADQPFWAHRLNSLGYALKPLKEKNIKVSNLVAALTEMEAESVIKKAQDIKTIIELENGVDNAVNYIEQVVQHI